MKILYLEDDANDVELVRSIFDTEGYAYELDTAVTRDDFISALNSRRYDLVLSDFQLPGYDGLSALAIHQKLCPEAPFILVSGSIGEERAIEALKSGATDYVMKEHLQRLGPAILRALEEARERSERRQAEVSLRRSEELFRRYFEAGLVGMTISRPGGQGWLQINDTYCRMLGYTRAELMDMKWTDLTHPDDLEEDKAQYKRLLDGEQDSYTKDKRFIRKDGSVLYAIISVACIRDADGTHKYNVVFIQDISDRKQAELALRKNESQLLEAQRLARLGFWERDIVKDDLYWSDELYVIAGVDRDKFNVTSESILGLVHPDDRQQYKEHFKALITRNIPFDCVQRVMQPDGEIRYHHSQAELIRDPHGLPLRIIGTVMDITERKRAELALLENEQRLKEAQSIAHLGYWERDYATNEDYWSEEIYAILGLDREKIKPDRGLFEEMLHPDDRESVLERIRLNYQGQASYPREYRIVRADGEVRHLHTQSGVDQDAGGKVIRSYGTLMDITERKRAEQALQQSEERLRRYFEAGLVGMSISKPGKGWLQLNDTFCEMFGYSREELMAKNWMEITHPDDLAEELVQQDRISAGEIDGYTRDKRYIRKDGRIIHVTVSLKCSRKQDGSIDDTVVFVQDISERKKAAEELQKAHAELEQRVEERTAELAASKGRAEAMSAIAETTLGNMDQGILMVDKDGKLQIYNDRLTSHTGVAREAAMACRSFDDYLLLGRARFGEAGYQRAAQIARVRERINYETRTEDGRYLEVRQNPLKAGGFVRTYTDITRLKEIHKDLEYAKEQAEAASIAKANFLATMSHEIRTPMNGVIGMTDLLLQTQLDDEQRQMLKTINECGQSLLTIINDILDFSKIEAGKLDLEAIAMSMSDVVEGSALTLAYNAERKGLRLIAYIDPKLPQFVIGDPVRVRQILINLGGNAVKFTEAGQVVIRAERLVNDTADDIIVRFSVTDQGIGISEAVQGRLFQAFTQAESSTTRRYGGTGLGLSICQRLAEMMGGEIGVNSVLGEGSEFYFTLTFKRCDKVRAHQNVSDLKGLRILLIVSDPDECQIYRNYLEHWHAEVVAHDNLSECLELCSAAQRWRLPYDIVVFGSQWTREEQFEMSERIAHQAALKETKFVTLLRGKRRQPRLENSACVALDVDQLRRATFLSAVSIAACRASPEVDYDTQLEELKAIRADAHGPGMHPPIARNMLILVAEDNPTNRDVISRQLRLLGYACDMADDGKLALAAWRGKDYDLLLTDCQMPNMDGFELTQAIRGAEAVTAKHTPIIAITANALQGESERCLAAGMDDYLSKPVNMKELREKLRRWLPRKPVAEDKLAEITRLMNVDTDNRAYPVDERALKDLLGDDPIVYKEIMNNFIDPTQRIIADIHHGWKERSAQDIKMAAHKLKSSARSIGANKLAELCLALETAGKDESWDEIEKDVPMLDRLMADVEDYITKL